MSQFGVYIIRISGINTQKLHEIPITVHSLPLLFELSFGD